MSSVLHRSRRVIACLAVLTPFVAASAAQADRGGVPHGGDGDAPMMMQAAMITPHVPCNDRTIEHPFTAWEDSGDYFLNKRATLPAAASYDGNCGGGELVAENNPDSLH